MNNKKNNAICSICGNPYDMCLGCKDQMNLHPWRMHCDTAEHFKVFQVIRGFNTKVYTKEEAKSKLEKIDLSDLETYREHIKNIVKDILKEEKVEIIETAKNKFDENFVANKPFRYKKSFKVLEQEAATVESMVESVLENKCE